MVFVFFLFFVRPIFVSVVLQEVKELGVDLFEISEDVVQAVALKAESFFDCQSGVLVD